MLDQGYINAEVCEGKLEQAMSHVNQDVQDFNENAINEKPKPENSLIKLSEGFECLICRFVVWEPE